MTISNSDSSINPQNGFCSKTLIFHSLRPPSSLPPPSSQLSVTDFVFSLTGTTAETASFIDATTRRTISYSDVPLIVRNLAGFLRRPPVSISHGDCAFVVSPNSSYIPILYLSLFSVGVSVSPVNPASSIPEISRLIRLCKPAVAFATSEVVHKLVEVGFTNRIIVIDSNEFDSMIRVESNVDDGTTVEVSQSDTAAILYSSGTTGNIKGVKLSHRNLISMIAGAIAGRQARSSPAVYLCTVPYFHAYGFSLCIRSVAFGDSLVSIGAGPYESSIVGTVGRIIAHCEAKIVDPKTRAGLPPMKHGELWVRGPFVMKDTMVDSDGWLRTGDLCYFDNEGFLFVVDRLKELIKYKGYQVPPAELEHILQSHPDIIEAAVIPYPDESAGQVPMGFVVRRKGSSIDETRVKDYVAKQVAPYKELRRVCFIDSIPKNAPGKVLRKELIKMAISGATSKL
ncbi:hypothetical protein R6Q57_020009 [Mikania cordata]